MIFGTVLGGLTLLFILAALMLAVCWPLALVRTAINDRLDKGQKIVWILLQIVFSLPASLIYLLFVDRSKFLKGMAFLTVAFCVLCGVFYSWSGVYHVRADGPVPIVQTGAVQQDYNCAEQVVKSPTFEQMTIRENETNTKLKAAAAAQEGSGLSGALGKMGYLSLSLRLTMLQTKVLNCQMTPERYSGLLDNVDKALASGKLKADIAAGKVDSKYIDQWLDAEATP